ncbi:MAG: bifunctional phosphopantothenoylcysteine decarboxylase/phosphopantothenate--cysteine ligase CoaBC [Anaerolineae bacterium]|nr:bifunctional phosphopantothenoylcysteine decarboxylase/phosphopantothenate--cysteine ligase CoaBC [Anaerolineae bacterium]
MEKTPVIKDKHILLGVSGGIAAYKACTVASHLTQMGAEVDVVMTEAATRFVGPLTFQALTGRAAYTDMWRAPGAGLPTHIAHIGLAHAADLLLIAPATANTMAKLAHGLADNLLSTLALAAACPLLLVPAMDLGMWAHPATQANVELLRQRGVHFAGPARGRMASGLEGEGRMIEPEEIVGHVRQVMGLEGPMAGWRVVVTAGPTREPLDPVRFLSNPSSGRQGFALAQAAVDRGAAVTLVAGPVDLPAPVGAERVTVTTADEMKAAVLAACERADLLLMATAVADYRPAQVAPHKIKKGAEEMSLQMVRTPDILSAVAGQRAESGFPRCVAGFAAETQDLLPNARAKLAAKGLDIIVANDVTRHDAGFGAATNRVVIVDRDGSAKELPLLSKPAVADAILDHLLQAPYLGPRTNRAKDK